MPTKKIAVVTGSNKGIGFAIVKGLCEKFKGEVYLTARDVKRGNQAVEKLKSLGLNPKFHQLDITDQLSVDNFRSYLKTTYGGIDLLINNAGLAFHRNDPEPIAVQAKKTIEVNYFGTLRVCEALFPLLRQNARVVNLSSLAGHLHLIKSADLRAKLSDSNLDISGLTKLMEKFLKDIETGKHIEEGWGSNTYVVSKVGVSALSIIQQRMFDAEKPNRNIAVNHVHPGFVITDMTGNKGKLTIEEGAKSALFAAIETDVKGKYIWDDCSIVDWYSPLSEDRQPKW